MTLVTSHPRRSTGDKDVETAVKSLSCVPEVKKKKKLFVAQPVSLSLHLSICLSLSHSLSSALSHFLSFTLSIYLFFLSLLNEMIKLLTTHDFILQKRVQEVICMRICRLTILPRERMKKSEIMQHCI